MHAEDGAGVWQLIQRAGTLDLNSAYLYLLLGKFFGRTCLVAEAGDALVGFTTAFVPPGRQDTVFLWQIGVDPEWQGQGIAGALVRGLMELDACRAARFLETTVTPSNKSSRALFASYARKQGTSIEELPCFPSQLFPDRGHEAEMLLRIGPLRS
ncbi:MAG TPA: diaminobutyrate acetyltransferase [Gammaproteobacteria bacterium]|nr:diaminobutyrate acetyltransferase [Gammaproteobacteria bacterium]